MAAEDILNGDYNMLYVYDTVPTAAYKPVACLTSNKLGLSREFKERKTMCNPGKTDVALGALSYEITVEGLFFNTLGVGGDTAKASADYLKSKIVAGELLTLKHVMGLNATPEYYKAYVQTLDITGQAGEDFTFSATFKVQGDSTAVNPFPLAT